MEEILSHKQKILLKKAKEKGFVTITDAKKLYSTDIFRKNALERLCDLGLLEETQTSGKFKIKK